MIDAMSVSRPKRACDAAVAAIGMLSILHRMRNSVTMRLKVSGSSR
jgi:hypothetical protein